MKYLFLIGFSLCVFLYNGHISSSSILDSKGKQQRYFPEELAKKGLYLGMTLEKVKKKSKGIQKVDTTSSFKIEAMESCTTGNIVSYTYLFTKTEQPQLYQIIITYDSIEGVNDQAIALLGEPNHQGEWHIEGAKIKEDFKMRIWTFGQKWVFSSTLTGNE